MAKPRKTKTIDIEHRSGLSWFRTTCVIHGNKHSQTRTLVGHPYVQIGKDSVQLGCIVITNEALDEIIKQRKLGPGITQAGDYGRPEDI